MKLFEITQPDLFADDTKTELEHGILSKATITNLRAKGREILKKHLEPVTGHSVVADGGRTLSVSMYHDDTDEKQKEKLTSVADAKKITTAAAKDLVKMFKQELGSVVKKVDQKKGVGSYPKYTVHATFLDKDDNAIGFVGAAYGGPYAQTFFRFHQTK